MFSPPARRWVYGAQINRWLVMFKTNTAVSNFPIGRLVRASDGTEIIDGAVTGTFILDGVSGALSGAIAYDAAAKCWVIDSLAAEELNGSIGGYSFSHPDAVGGGVFISIKTVQKLVSELAEPDNAGIASAAIASAAAATDAAEIEKIVGADWTIDTTVSPWQLVLLERGTATELLRKNLRQTNGAAITAADQIIGQQLQP